MGSSRRFAPPSAVLGATVRWFFFSVLLAGVGSCTIQREVHEPQRANLEAACNPGTPIVGLGPATDARTTQAIGRYARQSDAIGLYYFNVDHEVRVGTELAAYASDVFANCLTSKGYCVQRDHQSLLASGPSRLVDVVLLSADLNNRRFGILLLPVARNRAAEIKIEVRDSSQKVLFSGNYSSFDAIDNIGPFTANYGDVDALYIEHVNKAIDEAVKKACDDPAFIAAIGPLSGPKPR